MKNVNNIHISNIGGNNKMTDVKALKKAIDNAGVTIVFLAEKMECSRNRVYSIIKGSDCSTSEIIKITKILHLSTEERNNIFFAEDSE